jgi:hypothetical protein
MELDAQHNIRKLMKNIQQYHALIIGIKTIIIIIPTTKMCSMSTTGLSFENLAWNQKKKTAQNTELITELKCKNDQKILKVLQSKVWQQLRAM